MFALKEALLVVAGDLGLLSLYIKAIFLCILDVFLSTFVIFIPVGIPGCIIVFGLPLLVIEFAVFKIIGKVRWAYYREFAFDETLYRGFVKIRYKDFRVYKDLFPDAFGMDKYDHLFYRISGAERMPEERTANEQGYDDKQDKIQIIFPLADKLKWIVYRDIIWPREYMRGIGRILASEEKSKVLNDISDKLKQVIRAREAAADQQFAEDISSLTASLELQPGRKHQLDKRVSKEIFEPDLTVETFTGDVLNDLFPHSAKNQGVKPGGL